MSRLVHPLQPAPRCSSHVRIARLWTRRAPRCAGAHRHCPACSRVQIPGTSARMRAREMRRIRFGTDALGAEVRIRRRRPSRH